MFFTKQPLETFWLLWKVSGHWFHDLVNIEGGHTTHEQRLGNSQYLKWLPFHTMLSLKHQLNIFNQIPIQRWIFHFNAEKLLAYVPAVVLFADVQSIFIKSLLNGSRLHLFDSDKGSKLYKYTEVIYIICNIMAKDKSLTHSPFHIKINIDSIH